MAASKDVTNIPLGQSQWMRLSSQDPLIQVRNRFFETNPTNQVDQVAFLARPGLHPWQSVGDGPIRGVYNQPGSFGSDQFVVSGDSLFRISNSTGVATFISNDLLLSSRKIAMAATGNIGSTPEYLFLADGRNLWVYIANGYATGVYTGPPSNGDVVNLAGTYYQFTSGSVDTGAPDGSVANPWLVYLSGTEALALLNFASAVNLTGTAGTDYSSTTSQNENAVGIATDATTATFATNTAGTAGNATVTTTTSTTAHWVNGATMTGGGTTSFNTVETPDGVGISDVCYVNEFVIVIPAQGQGVNGRFYWIEPGEIIIRPLNFATAEHSPDPITQCLAVGDQFWLLGTSSLEVWYPTGDNTAPFQSIQGRLFEQGFWGGSAVKIKNVVIAVGLDGRVYSIGDSPQTISTPAIEEQIRSAIRISDNRIT